MYYVNQRNYPHIPYVTMVGVPEMVNTTTTVSNSGCGLCSASMVVTNLTGELFSLADALELSITVGANHSPGTDMSVLAPYLAERFDLELTVTSDKDIVRAGLQRGCMGIANVGGDRPEDNYIGVFSHGGHFVTVVGIDEAGENVTILDPSQTADKFQEDGRRDKVIVNGYYLHCSLDTLMQDCMSRPTECYPVGSEFRAWLDHAGKASAENHIYLFEPRHSLNVLD